MKREVLLICGSFKSANYSVMVDVIRAMDDNVLIHAVSTQGDVVQDQILENDIKYYSITNKARQFDEKFQSHTKRNVTVLLNIYRIIKESLVTTSDEKRIAKYCDEIICSYNIKAVFSVLLPTYSHKVAICLAKKHPKLQVFQFWLDQFSNRKHGVDSKVKSIVDTFFIKRMQAIERYCFDSVDTIYALPETFIGNETIKEYRNKLCLFEIPYIKQGEFPATTNNIVYAGSFLLRIREPKPVLDIISEALPLINSGATFHFYVPDPSLFKRYEEKSKGKMIFEGYLRREELYNVLSESKMLLTIGNKGISGMPSKTVEYISYRKPILFFYADDNDASKRYFDYYPDVCSIDVRQDISLNAKKLADFINAKHSIISYEDLMNVKVFRESTPEFIRSIIKFRL